MVSGLLGFDQLLILSSVLLFEVGDLKFMSQFNLIVFLLLILQVVRQSLPILVVLLFLLFSLVHEFLFHLIYFDLGLFLAYDRLSIRTLQRLQHGLMSLPVLLGFLLFVFQLVLDEL